ncbi:MAG: hypothetical protein IT373_25800 [Polyangiaceae bacterium]|nr:hypothetical protein [Polyangiaceae bacterium]
MEPATTQQTAFRLPTALLERLDGYAERLRAEQPGITITRADVVRLLLTRALDEVDKVPSRSGLRRRR